MKKTTLAICVSILMLGLVLLPVIPAEASFSAYVSTDAVNVRSAPSTSASIIGQLYDGEAATIVATVEGDSVAGTTTWYQLDSGGYVTAAYMSQTRQGGTTSSGHAGHWVDVNISTQTATAYDGNTPVYTAGVTTGKSGFDTPTGTYSVFSRLISDDMAGADYFQANVPYVQYFAGGGYALHGNYWQPDYVFGNIPTSHGCVGMRVGDAAFFYNFLGYGSTVSIHY